LRQGFHQDIFHITNMFHLGMKMGQAQNPRPWVIPFFTLFSKQHKAKL
jgi:hypothetical protein